MSAKKEVAEVSRTKHGTVEAAGEQEVSFRRRDGNLPYKVLQGESTNEDE